jgi:hypothetical protein
VFRVSAVVELNIKLEGLRRDIDFCGDRINKIDEQIIAVQKQM